MNNEIFHTEDLQLVKKAPDPGPKQKDDIVRLNSGSPLHKVIHRYEDGRLELLCRGEVHILSEQCVYRITTRN